MSETPDKLSNEAQDLLYYLGGDLWCEARVKTCIVASVEAIRDHAAQLESALADAQEQAAQGERLREAVTGETWYQASSWHQAAAMTREQEGYEPLAERCSAIATVLEAQEKQEENVFVAGAAPDAAEQCEAFLGALDEDEQPEQEEGT